MRPMLTGALVVLAAFGHSCTPKKPTLEPPVKDFRLPSELIPLERRTAPQVTEEERLRFTRELQEALLNRNDAGVLAALEKGADPNLRLEIPPIWKAELGAFHGKAQATAIAAERNDAKVLEWLLKFGADPNLPAEGMFGLPLNRALWSARDEKVMLLFRAGLRVDSRDENGETPLDVSVMGQRIDIACELVRLGAKVQDGQKGGLYIRWYLCEHIGLLPERDADIKMLRAELAARGQTWNCDEVNRAMEADRLAKKNAQSK